MTHQDLVMASSEPVETPQVFVEDTSALRFRCDELVTQSQTASDATNNLAEARHLVDQFPKLHLPNLTLRIVMERAREKAGMLESWLEMHASFPECQTAQRYCVRWYKRHHLNQEASAFVDQACISDPEKPDDYIHSSLLLEELGEFDRSDDVLRAGIEEFPEAVNLRVVLARNLKNRGQVDQAWKAIEPQPQKSPSGQTIQKELKAAVETLDSLGPDNWREFANAKIIAMNFATRLFRDRKPPTPNGNSIGSTVFLTGSLGAGGAERQMVNSAINLERLRREHGDKHDRRLDGPFQLVITSLEPNESMDFFLPAANAGQVPVTEIRNLPLMPCQEICPEWPQLSSLLPILPKNCLFGVQRLVAYFRREKTQIAFLWQDGAVLQGALAALIAGVPRIILNLRGLPPNIRPHLFREEYEDMYRSLVGIPGVEFVSNGRTTMRAYCDWINIPDRLFTVIPNGVIPAPLKDKKSDRDMWSEFDRRTSGASHTVGGVFRFDTDKRPQLWMKFARAYLRRHPNARFLLVGGGRLLASAEEFANKYELEDRILFVGESDNVSYWLPKIDAFLLLSLFEGLPNVLIEAQMSGVPVVSTPAGNAGDTFLQNETGILLSQVAEPSIDEICEKVHAASLLAQQDPSVSQRARDFAGERFSIEAMVKNTIQLLSTPLDGVE